MLMKDHALGLGVALMLGFPGSVAAGAAGGARMIGTNFVVVNSEGTACLIFGDGFESGDTGAWGNMVP